MTNTIIVIPSRLAATRLPNKPLLKINGLSIINHVYEKAKSAKIGDVFVATGDEEIFEEVIRPKGRKYLLRVQKRLAKLRDESGFYTEEANDVLDELEEKGFFSF